MALATLDDLEHIKATDDYQKQLHAVYNVIEINKYTQLSVIVDFNAYGDAVLELLPHTKQIKPEVIKRIHHTFDNDLVLIDIPIQRVQGQCQLEQLLAIAIFENVNDVAEYSMARSVCLWLFDQPITEQLKQSLFKMGRAIDYQSNKQRYLRYWDPRVLPVLLHVWNQMQKLKIRQLGIESISYVDWNNEFVTFKPPLQTQVLITEEDNRIFEKMKQPPFWFNDKQWTILLQVEWINMVFRQLKEHIKIDAESHRLVMNQALNVLDNKISKQKVLSNIAKQIESRRFDREE